MAGETLTDIFRRVMGGNETLPPPGAAEYFLSLKLSREDRRRMEDFFYRCNEGELTPEEEKEYEAYCDLGLFIAWLHSKSRTALAARESVADHGSDATRPAEVTRPRKAAVATGSAA